MIFRIEDLKKVCGNILYAVDNQSTFDNENVQLKIENNILSLKVTNSEYFVTVTLPVDCGEESLCATVNANLFLKLISQISTDTVELLSKDRYLVVKGNGEYKVPIIYVDDTMLTLSPIEIDGQITMTTSIGGDILNGILLYNSKELLKGVIAKPVQKLFYVDNEGAITFTTGACVNSFHIETPFSVLLTPKIVRLFKLFDSNDSVKFSIGGIERSGLNLTGVRFESDSIKITAILPDNSLITSVPVKQIRGMVSDVKKYSVTINRKNMLDALNRLMLFSVSDSISYGRFVCEDDSITISLRNSSASEKVYFDGKIEDSYKMLLNLKDLKASLEAYSDMFVVMGFGDNTSITISHGNVHNILPECVEM